MIKDLMKGELTDVWRDEEFVTVSYGCFTFSLPYEEFLDFTEELLDASAELRRQLDEERGNRK